MNQSISQRVRDVLVWLLVSIVGVLLLAESWYAFRTSLALFRWDVVLFHQPPLSPGIYMEAIQGLLLFAAAGLCIKQRTDFLKWCLIPAILLIPYGLWTAHYFGKFMMSVRGALDGDDIALNFLRGVGFAAIGVLALIARALSRYRYRSD